MKGFHVAINDQNSPLDLDGVDVQTGTFSNIAISQTKIKKISTRNHECRQNLAFMPGDSIYYKYSAEVSTYSQVACQTIFIILNEVLATCQCLEVEKLDFKYFKKILSEYNTTVCRTIAELNCIKRVFSNYKENVKYLMINLNEKIIY